MPKHTRGVPSKPRATRELPKRQASLAAAKALKQSSKPIQKEDPEEKAAAKMARRKSKKPQRQRKNATERSNLVARAKASASVPVRAVAPHKAKRAAREKQFKTAPDSPSIDIASFDKLLRLTQKQKSPLSTTDQVKSPVSNPDFAKQEKLAQVLLERSKESFTNWSKQDQRLLQSKYYFEAGKEREQAQYNFTNFFEVIKSLKANETIVQSDRMEDETIKEKVKPHKNLAVPLRVPTQAFTQAIEADFQQKCLDELRNSQQKQEGGKNQNSEQPQLRSDTFINCDLRFFNFKYLHDQVGDFQVIHIDPPWRIKGGQRNNTSFMFSNNKFNLNYSTMSNQEIMNIPVEDLSKSGFCFLWVLNSQMDIGYKCMEKWGYKVVDQITWIKTKNGKVHISHGFYLLHSSEVCLVGYKCEANHKTQFNSKMSNNLIFAEIRKKSQKPDQIYTLMELMLPTANKIELFARNNNLREGWLSLGNQLGENYVRPKRVFECKGCSEEIEHGSKRFKSKVEPGIDLCEDCMIEADPKDYFELMNNLAEDENLHEYFQCNMCHCEPICGPRFQCSQCQDVDICELCMDKRLEKIKNGQDTLCKDHKIYCIEIPLLANGLEAHPDHKCVVCYMGPIIGGCFTCSQCPSFAVCQNCYFTRQDALTTKKYRGHDSTHSLNLKVKYDQQIQKIVKCQGCLKTPITGVRYLCTHCFDFNLCEKCFLKHSSGELELKSNFQNHHMHHQFHRLNMVHAPKAEMKEQEVPRSTLGKKKKGR